MRQRLGGAVVGLALALGLVAPAAAQDWFPAYGYYGYGTGFENSRNPYGYPRPTYAQGRSVPRDDWALYGGYMPNAYYTGAGYSRESAVLFPSGRAYCQTAGSYLYCADINSGGGQLMSMRDESLTVRAALDYSWVGQRNEDVYGGVINTRTVGDQSQFVGTLVGPDGQQVAIDCAGATRRPTINLSCH
jgi:hypothetical protein